MKRHSWIWLFCFILILQPSFLGFIFSLFFCDFFGTSCNYGIFSRFSAVSAFGAGGLFHFLLLFGTAVQIIRSGKPADFSKPDLFIRSYLILEILTFALNRLYIESLQNSSAYISLILSALKTIWLLNSLVSAGFFFYLSVILKNEFFKVPSFLIIGMQTVQFLETDRGNMYLGSVGAILTSVSIAYAVWNSKVIEERLNYFRIYSILLIVKLFINFPFTAAVSYFGTGTSHSFYGIYSYLNICAELVFQVAIFNAFWYFSEKEIIRENTA